MVGVYVHNHTMSAALIQIICGSASNLSCVVSDNQQQ